MNAALQTEGLEDEEHRPVFKKAFLEVRWPLYPSTRAPRQLSRVSGEKRLFPGVAEVPPAMAERLYLALWDGAIEELGMRTRQLRTSDGRRGLVALLHAEARGTSVDAGGQLAREYVQQQFLEVIYECPNEGLGIYRLAYDPETSQQVPLPKAGDFFGNAPLWQIYAALDRLSRISMLESDAWLKRTEKLLDVKEASSREGRTLVSALNALRESKPYKMLFPARTQDSSRWFEAALSALQRVGLIVFNGPTSMLFSSIRFTDCEEPAAEAIVLRLDSRPSKPGPKRAVPSAEVMPKEPLESPAASSQKGDDGDEEDEECDKSSTSSSKQASLGPLLDEDTSGEWLDPVTLRVWEHPPVVQPPRAVFASRMKQSSRPAAVVRPAREKLETDVDEVDADSEDPPEAADEAPTLRRPSKPRGLSAADRKAFVAKLLAKQTQRVDSTATTKAAESPHETFPAAISPEVVPEVSVPASPMLTLSSDSPTLAVATEETAVVGAELATMSPSVVTEEASAEFEKLPPEGVIESLTTALRGVVRALECFPQREVG